MKKRYVHDNKTNVASQYTVAFHNERIKRETKKILERKLEKRLTEGDEAAVQHGELDLAGDGGDAVPRIEMTLPGRFLRRPGRASAPVVMMVPPVRVGMGTGGGRGGTGSVGTDAAQPEDTAAGRLRPQRRHLLRKQTGLLSSLPLRTYIYFHS